MKTLRWATVCLVWTAILPTTGRAIEGAETVVGPESLYIFESMDLAPLDGKGFGRKFSSTDLSPKANRRAPVTECMFKRMQTIAVSPGFTLEKLRTPAHLRLKVKRHDYGELWMTSTHPEDPAEYLITCRRNGTPYAVTDRMMKEAFGSLVWNEEFVSYVLLSK